MAAKQQKHNKKKKSKIATMSQIATKSNISEDLCCAAVVVGRTTILTRPSVPLSRIRAPNSKANKSPAVARGSRPY